MKKKTIFMIVCGLFVVIAAFVAVRMYTEPQIRVPTLGQVRTVTITGGGVFALPFYTGNVVTPKKYAHFISGILDMLKNAKGLRDVPYPSSSSASGVLVLPAMNIYLKDGTQVILRPGFNAQNYVWFFADHGRPVRLYSPPLYHLFFPQWTG